MFFVGQDFEDLAFSGNIEQNVWTFYEIHNWKD